MPSQNPRGDGPNQVSTIAGDKVVVVGDNANIRPSVYMDPTGKERDAYGISKTSGMVNSKTAIPTFQSIDNGGDFHGGNYTVTALNGIHLESAGGGTSIDSSGNVSIASWGGKVDITSTQQAAVKAQVVRIMATNTIELTGSTFYVDTKETVFNRNVIFGKNVMINGGAFINGELYATHITTPRSVGITAASSSLYGYPASGGSMLVQFTPEPGPLSPTEQALVPGGLYRCTILPDPVNFAIGGTPIVTIPSHQHYYDTIAFEAKDGQTDFFEEASDSIESEDPNKAKSNNLAQLSLKNFAKRVEKMVQHRLSEYIKSFLGF